MQIADTIEKAFKLRELSDRSIKGKKAQILTTFKKYSGSGWALRNSRAEACSANCNTMEGGALSSSSDG